VFKKICIDQQSQAHGAALTMVVMVFRLVKTTVTIVIDLGLQVKKSGDM
jgi:hypothetical protein